MIGLSFFQVELKFRVGDVIYVYGDMDEDGFFAVSRRITKFFSSSFSRAFLSCVHQS